MGIIADFVQGAAKGAEKGLDLQQKSDIAREISEANFRRDSNLKQLMAGKEREFRRGESKLERESKERVSAAKPVKQQTIKVTDEGGMEVDAILNPDGTYTLPRKAGAAPGGEVQVSEDQAQRMAQDEYDSKSEYFTSDQAQFGMSEPEWVNKRMLEIMVGKAAGTAPTKPGRATKKPKPTGQLTEAQFLDRVKQRAQSTGKIYNEEEAKANYQSRTGDVGIIKKKRASKKPSKAYEAYKSAVKEQEAPAKKARAEREASRAQIGDDYERKFKAMPDSQKRVWWRKNFKNLRKYHSKLYREGKKIIDSLSSRRSIIRTAQEAGVQ